MLMLTLKKKWVDSALFPVFEIPSIVIRVALFKNDVKVKNILPFSCIFYCLIKLTFNCTNVLLRIHTHTNVMRALLKGGSIVENVVFTSLKGKGLAKSLPTGLALALLPPLSSRYHTNRKGIC